MNQPSEEAATLRAALSITDGTSVPAPESAPDSPDLEHTTRTLANLRVIEEIADAFTTRHPERAAQSGAPESGAPGALFTWGTLEVRRSIGEGGYGEVFAAWDPALEREVALKLRSLR